MRGYLIRLPDGDPGQTLGYFVLFNGLDKLMEAVTLELPDRGNQRGISRIPAGTYTVVKRYSQRYGWHYHVLDVQGRTLILIHVGNFVKNTRGCILMAASFSDLNGDGQLDIASSGPTLEKLLSLAGQTFELTIYEEINYYPPPGDPGRLGV